MKLAFLCILAWLFLGINAQANVEEHTEKGIQQDIQQDIGTPQNENENENEDVEIIYETVTATVTEVVEDHVEPTEVVTATVTEVVEPTESPENFEHSENSDESDDTVRTSRHTNNWAVLVSTSRFWFNYRHMANVLSMYRTVKRLGIPDSQIILMLSDDVSCNPRNAFPGAVFNNADRGLDLYGANIEVDYRGYEVTVENFIRLLTDRWDPDTPRSKRLLTDERSNIFIYMTGHGGNEFLKFQDADEIGAQDLADAFEQMWEKHRYNEIFFMIDTCQANTMYSKFYSPNILAVGSSDMDENSYSHHSDLDVGVAVIDRFTYYNLEFLEEIKKTSKKTMQSLFDSYSFNKIHSNPGIKATEFARPLDEILITDFFGNIQDVYVDNQEHDLLELASITKKMYEAETNRSRLAEIENEDKKSGPNSRGGLDDPEAAKAVGHTNSWTSMLDTTVRTKLGELGSHTTAGIAATVGVLFAGLSWYL